MSKLNKIKSAVISGAMAVSAVVSPLAGALTPSLTVDAAASDNYAKLLEDALTFYDANMCGNITGKCKVSWRSNCHMDDDVPGGYHDAGDHVMFGQPQGYAASTLGWAYYEFSDAFEATGTTSHYKTIADHFCEFFRNATKMSGGKVTSVLIEKGEGGLDHGYWGPPEQQGSRGRMLWSNGNCANISAEYAAALALNYINFGNEKDLEYAKALYDFSVNSPGYYSCDFYNGQWTGSDDEIAWAACWLYKATNDSKYKDGMGKVTKAYYTHGWENVSLGAGIMKGELTGDWSATQQLGEYSGSNYFFQDQWGSARHNCTAQLCSLVAAKNSKGSPDWAKGQMNYILGDNPANTCFVVGFASNSATSPHHRAASGMRQGDFNGQFDEGNHMANVTKYGAQSHVLTGALVGGPCDASGTYHDNMNDYICNEVAIDYNAGLVGAAAGLYHFYKTGTPQQTTPQQTTPQQTTPQQTTPQQTTQAQQTQAPQQTTQSQNVSGTKFDVKDTYEGVIGDMIKSGAKSITFYINASGATAFTYGFGVSISKDPWWNELDKSGKFIDTKGGTVDADGTETKLSAGLNKVTIDLSSIPVNYADSSSQWGEHFEFRNYYSDKNVTLTITDVKMNDSSASVTTTPAVTTQAQQQTTKATTQAQQTQAPQQTTQNQNVSGTKFDVKDTYEGVLGDLVKSGAKSITFYIDASGATAFTYGFGISISKDPWWNELDKSGKFIDTKGGTVDADGTETKLSAGLNKVTIDLSSISPSYSDSSSEWGEHFEFRNYYSDKSVTLKITDVKVNDSSAPVTTAPAVTTKATTKATTAATTKATTAATTKATTQAQQQPQGNIVYGDSNCDGKVNIADAVAILQYLANGSKYPLTDQGKKNADVDGSAGVTGNDALTIQKYDAGSLTKLPV